MSKLLDSLPVEEEEVGGFRGGSVRVHFEAAGDREWTLRPGEATACAHTGPLGGSTGTDSELFLPERGWVRSAASVPILWAPRSVSLGF